MPRVGKNTFRSQESNQSGTISVSGYMSGTVDYLKDTILSVLEAYYLEYPHQREFLKPVIERTKETIDSIVNSNRKLISAGQSDLALYKEEIAEYERLINKEPIAEQELQDFFEKHSRIIDTKIKKLIPKLSFGGERYPDFVAILINGNHILIEIEKPVDKIYTKSGDPTSEFSHAEQQIQNYLQWLYDDPNYLRRRELPSINVENTKGLIIIGLSKNLSLEEKRKLEMKNFATRSSHETKTFDQILAENQNHLRCLSERNDNIHT